MYLMAKWTTTCFGLYLRQPEDGQYGPKHVVVYLVIKYTYVTQLCLTIYNF